MNDARSAQALKEHSPEQYEELMTIARLAQAGGWPMPNAPEEDDEELRLRGEYEARHAASSAHLARMQVFV
jgi:N-formylglutamate amidohydrolase